MHFETIAVHSGFMIDSETGAVAPPIHLSTTFQRDESGQTPRGFAYIRDANPNGARLEEALAAIDGAESALVFGSGMAAIAALMQSIGSGHVILPDDCYYGLRAMAREHFASWGLTFDLVAMENLDAVRAAMRDDTRLLWAETPSNPLMKVVDLRGLAEIAHRGVEAPASGASAAGSGRRHTAPNAIFGVDSTFATPALQRPIELGADVVMHSTTKYLGGHTDVMGGSLAFRRRDSLYEKALRVRTILGGVASPFNSWLVLRGIRSLAARMRVHCENAAAVAQFLSAHSRVERVFYPGLASHERHDVAARQMSAFGGMLSFLVKGGAPEALGVAAKTRVFTRATSLGGVESLIEHRNTSEGAGSVTDPRLLRCSVGLEHAGDLIGDLKQALE